DYYDSAGVHGARQRLVSPRTRYAAIDASTLDTMNGKAAHLRTTRRPGCGWVLPRRLVTLGSMAALTMVARQPVRRGLISAHRRGLASEGRRPRHEAPASHLKM